MKKTLLLIAAFAAAAAFAAYDFQPARAIPLGSAVTVDANTTNTTAVTLYGIKGNAELLVYASGATNRTGGRIHRVAGKIKAKQLVHALSRSRKGAGIIALTAANIQQITLVLRENVT